MQSQTTEIKKFVPNPGLGWVFKNAVTPQGYGLWEGTFTTFIPTTEGECKRMSLQAVAIRAPREATKAELKAHAAAGGDRYEFKIVEIGADGEPWKYVGSFVLPAFGERKTQVIDTPVGKLVSWIQAPRNKSDWTIRFRMLRDSTGVVRATRPM